MAALVLLQALACTTPDSYRIELERGDVALAAGNPDDAEDAYRRALAWRPQDPAALDGIARCHLARGDGEAALAALTRLSRSDPLYFRAHGTEARREALHLAAEQSLRRGDPARSIALLNRLQAQDPGRPGVEELHREATLVEAGRLYAAGRTQEGEALARRALRSDVAGADAALELAVALIETGRLDAGISVLSDAILRHPDDARLRALMDETLEIRYPDQSERAP